MNTLFNAVIQEKQFNFQPLAFGTENGYHIDVKDEEGTRWEFTMFPSAEKKVKIEGEKLPSWIYDLESELIRAINQHE
ncbi:MAG: hypothetical protein WKF97_08800 [Chitinophagaceae bacterium]